MYAIKNHAYCAVFPRLVGIAKQAISVIAHPTYPYNIQGLAFPSLLCVLSIMDPKKMSVKPSNNLENAINVPTIPDANPTVSVKYTMINDVKNAYTTFPAMSPEPYPTLLYHFKYFFSSIRISPLLIILLLYKRNHFKLEPE